jgi:glycosyltransferase involved in cell wall biosynthesis
MKIIINASSIYKGGAEQVVNSFINECRSFPENEYHIFLCDNIMNDIDSQHFPDNFHFYLLNRRPSSSYYSLYKALNYFSELEEKINPDVVISTGGHGYWQSKAPLVTGFNIPHYVYPESPYFRKISAKRKVYWKLKKAFDLRFYKKSDAIIVQTNDVKERLEKLVPRVPVHVVSNTVNGAFINPKEVPKKLPERTLNSIRLLTVSANYPHKNLDIIKDVLDELLVRGITEVFFVLTLPEKVFRSGFSDERYRNHIINVGPIPIHECPALYQECDLMFLPTLLECFSASYAEAMYMKRPILTSDLPFARTVCQRAAVYFDPLNHSDIADNIQNLIHNRNMKNRLIKEGKEIIKQFYSPQQRAEQFLSICRSVVKNEHDTLKDVAIGV